MRRKQICEDKRGRKLCFLLSFFLLSCTTSILSILCLGMAEIPFVQTNFIVFAVLVCAGFVGLFCVASYMVYAEKSGVVKGLITLYIFLAITLLICVILQKTGFFRVVDSPENLQEYLKKAGVWMPLLYVLLQFLQVVILPIPSVVSTIAGVALFGAFWAMIYSLLGILLGSIAAFFIGRKWGNKAVVWLTGEEVLLKWQKKLKGKDRVLLTLMFILPLFPDDVLCFVAGLSTMSVRYFFTVVLTARFVGVFATCYSIDFIPFTTWWGITLWGVFAVVIVLSFFIVYRRAGKTHVGLSKFCQKRTKKN